MKFTIKELLAAEPQMVEVIKVMIRKMFILNDLQQESMETVIEFPIIKDAEEHPKLIFRIKKHSLRALGVDVGEQLISVVHIPNRGHRSFKMESEDIERGYCKEEDITEAAKSYIRELGMGMAAGWLRKSGDLELAMKYLENDEIQEIRDLFNGMIDIHYSDTGCSIALIGVNGEPIATDAKFAKVDIDHFRSADKTMFKNFIKQKLPNYIIYGWAFSGHFDSWKEPVTKTVEEM